MLPLCEAQQFTFCNNQLEHLSPKLGPGPQGIPKGKCNFEIECNRWSDGLLSPGVAARETAQALKTLAQAARGVAASTSDPAAAHAMLDSARDVMEGSAMLIQEAKQALIAPGDAERQQRLAQVSLRVRIAQ
jgi:hypothetical protein